LSAYNMNLIVCVLLLNVEGQMQLTPSTLHEMWTEEGIKAHELKTRYEEILKAKGVRPYNQRACISL